ncbi:MAG: type II secretion system F family protein, partial [bacterium]|nr:type II secretion system F family protein [bacterium]
MLEKNKKLSSLDTLFLGKEKEYFIDNFATLVSSGIGVLTALESVKLEIHSKRLKKVVDAMKDDIEEGTPIWLAFEKSGILPKNVIALVKIGEQTGRLSENLKIIAIQQKKDRSFRSKIRSGMMYPGFVLGLTLVVGLVVAWFIIPRLANVFAGLHIDLPLITRVLIATGAFLGQYGYIAVPSFLLIVAVSAYFIFTFSKTKFIGEA